MNKQQAQITHDKDDKHPLRKKQQAAVSEGSDKKKELTKE